MAFKIAFISAAALSFILANTAWANNYKMESQQSESKHPTFSQLDKNKDGVLSREEVKDDPALSSSFDLIDKNGDGKIDRDEFSVYRGDRQSGK